MPPRFHVLKRVSKHGFKAMLWVMVLGSRRSPLMAIQPLPPTQKLENIVRQLNNLRCVWHFTNPSRRIQFLNIAADGLDDLVEQLAPSPGFTRNERKLLNLALGIIAAGGFFLAGVHYERHNSFAPNVAKVGP